MFSVLFTSLKIFIFAVIGIFIVIRKQNYNLKIYYARTKSAPEYKMKHFYEQIIQQKV